MNTLTGDTNILGVSLYAQKPWAGEMKGELL